MVYLPSHGLPRKTFPVTFEKASEAAITVLWSKRSISRLGYVPVQRFERTHRIIV